MCCSRRKHNAGLKGKPHEKVELNQIWLDWLPGCDLRLWVVLEVDGKSCPDFIISWDCCLGWQNV